MIPGAMRTQQDLIGMHFALPADEWIIQIVSENDSSRRIRQEISWRKLFSSVHVAWFRARNADNCHIYGRPRSTRYVLVDLDDNGAEAIQRMRDDNFPRSAVLETSPGKFQVWIAVSKEELPIPVASELGKLIAMRYGGDVGSTDAMHLGRLPGLRNKKTKYRSGENDGGPLVRLRVALAAPKIPSCMPEMVAEAERRAETCTPSSSSALGACALATTKMDIDPWRSPMTETEAREIYEAELQSQALRKSWKLPIEKGLRSQADYAVAYSLRFRYGYNREDIAVLLLHASGKATKRGMGYVTRTTLAIENGTR